MEQSLHENIADGSNNGIPQMRQVLILEDDRILSYLLSRQIKKLGYAVAGRMATGEAALIALKELNPDLLLVDINLEGNLDGIEFINLIRKFSDVPFIYLTGNTDPLTKRRAMKTKPSDYLVKPVELEVLERALQMAMQNVCYKQG